MYFQNHFPLLAVLRQMKYFFVFSGAAFLFFDISYYLMLSLPGSRDNMCVMGANLTLQNIFFSIFTSLFFALAVVGVFALFQKTFIRNKIAFTSVSGMGFGLGSLTLFCPICALPVFSALGVSLGLDFFNQYNVFFKLLSLALLIFGLYLLNQQLKTECKRCIPLKLNF